MLLKNKKGFSLIELLVVVAILGVVSPLLFIIFASGIEDFSTTSKYLDEQYTVMEVTRHIRQDVEEAETITFIKDASPASPGVIKKVKFEFPSSGGVTPKHKTWEFKNNGLYLQIDGEAVSTVLVNDLDSESKFAIDPNGDAKDVSKLILIIKPTQLNKKYPGRNVDENINTEFSVRYKNKKDDVAP